MTSKGRTRTFLAGSCVLGCSIALIGSSAAFGGASGAQPQSTEHASCTTRMQLVKWPTSALAEQTLVVPVDETDVTSVRSEIADGAGGLILFGSAAPNDLASVLSSIRAAAPRGITPFVMADEEGGLVQRMANLVGSLPAARTMGATMSPAQIEALAYSLGKKLKGVGVTMDLAPVLDVDGGVGPNNRDPDGTRSFSPTESIASRDGLAFAEGLGRSGVVPVVKHFPGLGSATGNTDLGPAATQPWSVLEHDGLLPFAAAVKQGLPAVMVSNASVPGLSNVPASISSTAITGVLRNKLHFKGLVITDSLSALSLHDIGYSVPAATVAALRAGADMVLYDAATASVASLTAQTADSIERAVGMGTLSRARLIDAVGHILTAKNIDLCSVP